MNLRNPTRSFIAAALALAAGFSCARFGAEPPPLAATPDIAVLEQDVRALADPKLEGRGLASPGLERAARYLLARFTEIGLKPAGDEGSFFQRFETVVAVRPGKRTALGFAQGEPPSKKEGPGEKLLFASGGDDFVPAGFSAEGEFSGSVVFVGYCLSEPAGRDDFGKLDVRAAVVLCLRGAPPGATRGPSPLKIPPAPQTDPASDRHKAFAARERGAAAVLLVTETGTRGRLPELEPSPLAQSAGLPVLFVSRELAVKLFETAGAGNFETAATEAADPAKPAGRVLAGIEGGGQVELVPEKRSPANVVGLLEPATPCAGPCERVVVGAHYDHLGYGGEGSLEPDTRAVHPGADDNASGVAALLQTARLLAAAPEHLGREVLFVAFAGEEKGLLGSAAFTDKLSEAERRRIGAMVNFDMVGRLDKSRLWLFGARSAEGLPELAERLAAESGFSLELSGEAYGPSDHTSFLAKEIPAVHFFTGAHADYHRPSDTADKIDYQGLARVSALAARLTLALASDPVRPSFLRPAGAAAAALHKDPGASGGGYGPYFGSVPDFSPVEGGGVRFAAIRPGSPADQAGIRSGDVLVRFGGSEIRNLYDFTFALRAHRPGDAVEAVVRRGDRLLKVSVTLAERR